MNKIVYKPIRLSNKGKEEGLNFVAVYSAMLYIRDRAEVYAERMLLHNHVNKDTVRSEKQAVALANELKDKIAQKFPNGSFEVLETEDHRVVGIYLINEYLCEGGKGPYADEGSVLRLICEFHFTKTREELQEEKERKARFAKMTPTEKLLAIINGENPFHI